MKSLNLKAFSFFIPSIINKSFSSFLKISNQSTFSFFKEASLKLFNIFVKFKISSSSKFSFFSVKDNKLFNPLSLGLFPI